MRMLKMALTLGALTLLLAGLTASAYAGYEPKVKGVQILGVYPDPDIAAADPNLKGIREACEARSGYPHYSCSIYVGVRFSNPVHNHRGSEAVLDLQVGGKVVEMSHLGAWTGKASKKLRNFEPWKVSGGNPPSKWQIFSYHIQDGDYAPDGVKVVADSLRRKDAERATIPAFYWRGGTAIQAPAQHAGPTSKFEIDARVPHIVKWTREGSSLYAHFSHYVGLNYYSDLPVSVTLQHKRKNHELTAVAYESLTAPQGYGEEGFDGVVEFRVQSEDCKKGVYTLPEGNLAMGRKDLIASFHASGQVNPAYPGLNRAFKC